MLLSRSKPATTGQGLGPTARNAVQSSHKVPELKDFVDSRDYTGALALLAHQKRATNAKDSRVEDELWTAFCAFHLGEYRTALESYERVRDLWPEARDVRLAIACCQFYLGMYTESKASAQASDDGSALFSRLMLHLCHKFGEESELIQWHQRLKDTVEDQLCLASVHYLRGHFQEAIDVYKKLLLERRDFIALNVYLSLCYYKLDYYDVAQEVLALYLTVDGHSVTATNLKACALYRLYNGKAAELELRNLIDALSPTFSYAKDLIRHNLVVFRAGDGALQVLPPLVDVLPEARLNLVIYHLKNDNVSEANNLIKDLDPSVPHEYILKGVVNAAIGQMQGSREHLKIAQQYFQMVGGSASECDTIPGRQCMASCFFLLKQFPDVLLYLSSIKSYFYNDDSFNFNLGQAKAQTAHYREAEEHLLAVQSQRLRTDVTYVLWLCRCLIMNGKARQAWEVCEKASDVGTSKVLQLVANDCYKMGHFLVAAKAFEALQRIDDSPEHWEGLRGATAGVLQLVVAEKESKSSLEETVRLVRSAKSPQSSQLLNAIKNWSKDRV